MAKLVRMGAGSCFNTAQDPGRGVILTMNHLESFNVILKRKHLPTWLHSGRCLWFDSLIHILIMQILSGIYSHRKAQQEYSDWLTDRFCDHAGGKNLAELHQKLTTEREAQWNLPVFFWPVDPIHNAAAEQVLTHRVIDWYHHHKNMMPTHITPSANINLKALLQDLPSIS